MNNLLDKIAKTQWKYQGQKGEYCGYKKEQQFFCDVFRYSQSNELKDVRTSMCDRLYVQNWLKQSTFNTAKYYGDTEYLWAIVKTNGNTIVPITNKEISYLETLDSVFQAIEPIIKIAQGKITFTFNKGELTENCYISDRCQRVNKQAYQTYLPFDTNRINILDIVATFLSNS